MVPGDLMGCLISIGAGLIGGLIVWLYGAHRMRKKRPGQGASSMDTEDIQIGDTVEVDNPGSWTHERVFWVKTLNVTSSDGIHGHLLEGHGGTTVVEPERLSRVAVGGAV